jgi:Mlc titration factor MtfA (ptsG expression regulator)
MIEAIIRREVALAAGLAPAPRERLLALTAEFVASKQWEGSNGFTPTPEMQIVVAANAVIPVLSFDLWPYENVRAVILRPGVATSRSLRSGPSGGTYRDSTVHVIGEATPRSGPVALTWPAVLRDSRHPRTGRNVVIHEFAHKIDMRNGDADGVPPLRGEALDRWIALLDDAFEGQPDESDEVLDSYAWESPAEYFAVATETYFCTPLKLATMKRALYDVLCDLYQQDPAGISGTGEATTPG